MVVHLLAGPSPVAPEHVVVGVNLYCLRSPHHRLHLIHDVHYIPHNPSLHSSYYNSEALTSTGYTIHLSTTSQILRLTCPLSLVYTMHLIIMLYNNTEQVTTTAHTILYSWSAWLRQHRLNNTLNYHSAEYISSLQFRQYLSPQ